MIYIGFQLYFQDLSTIQGIQGGAEFLDFATIHSLIPSVSGCFRACAKLSVYHWWLSLKTLRRISPPKSLLCLDVLRGQGETRHTTSHWFGFANMRCSRCSFSRECFELNISENSWQLVVQHGSIWCNYTCFHLLSWDFRSVEAMNSLEKLDLARCRGAGPKAINTLVGLLVEP